MFSLVLYKYQIRSRGTRAAVYLDSDPRSQHGDLVHGKLTPGCNSRRSILDVVSRCARLLQYSAQIADIRCKKQIEAHAVIHMGE